MYRTVFFKKRVIILFVFLSSCAGKESQTKIPYYNTPDFTPLFLSGAEALQKVGHTIAPFSFTDQYGKQVSNNTIRGKIHVADFIFTSCSSICPVMTKNMKILQDKYRNNPGVEMLSFSVTPWIDSVPKLQQYAKANNITASNWHLLTGDKAAIYKLARQSYFAEEDLGFSKDSTEFLHTEHIVLVDDTGRIRGIYNGTLKLDAISLAADIEELLKEK